MINGIWIPRLRVPNLPMPETNNLPPFELVDFESISPVACPCGWARRALMETPDFPGSLHLTQITKDARTHFHKEHLEVYYFVECEPGAKLELNGVEHPVQVGQAVLIRAGTHHRAIGEMKVLILSMPEFDPLDEHFGEQNQGDN